MRALIHPPLAPRPPHEIRGALFADDWVIHTRIKKFLVGLLEIDARGATHGSVLARAPSGALGQISAWAPWGKHGGADLLHLLL
jgi:hypothetical protein